MTGRLHRASVTPMPKAGPKPKRKWSKPLPWASSKRRSEKEQREIVRQACMRRDGFRCVAADLIPELPCEGGLEVHEVIPRSAWPGGHLVLSNTRTLCHGHHQFVTDHPRHAHLIGLHGFSWEREVEE